ncbi:hypothetical protein HUJ04_006920 [Dendroctonus ponderosae]|nr:hypothetical protein HUJ04_006920 [Dendroctonus ponderosae]
MANIIAKARFLLHACYPLLSGKLCLRTKARVYKQLIRPVLTYGSAAWFIASTTQKQKLAVFQNKILSIVPTAPYFVRNTTLRRDLDTEDLLDHIRNLTSGFLDRIRHSKKPTVRKKTWTTSDDQFLHHNEDHGLDLKSKREHWKSLCEDLDNDIWGKAYQIITKRLNIRKRLIPDNNTIKRQIENAFPKKAIINWTGPATALDTAITPFSEEELKNAVQ